MKNFYVRFSLALTLIVFGLSFVSPFSRAQRSTGQMVPAKAEFLNDAFSGRISGDPLGAYIDGKTQCVSANVSRAGYFYLRTATNRCNTTTPRRINIDFTDALNSPTNCPGFIPCPHAPIEDDFGQPGSLDMCGPNSLLDVTIRAQRLFADPIPTNQLTEVQIYFNLSPDFKNTAFYLNGVAYIQQGSTLNERVLTTGADLSEFYLVMIKKTGEKVCLGNYYMPFTIKVPKGV
jgi:hypothetical protein